jgi:hypothetical protein
MIEDIKKLFYMWRHNKPMAIPLFFEWLLQPNRFQKRYQEEKEFQQFLRNGWKR